MGQALYRKYRSKSLSEIVGQEHITTALGRALKSGRISHAYLFTGPRGTGKTSVARILAHQINGLSYVDDRSHLDIIEIDAASNRRIDEIRELRDKVYVAPAQAKYKVYIIDEVHMLTREAFNALLKTLEEPPEHVVFILATTDAHKLPETIISRTQRFSFRPVETSKVVEHLRSIAKQEGIKIDDDALQLLAEHGEGSFRDSISLLDQIGAHRSKISKADIQTLLGIPPAEAIRGLTRALADQQAKALISGLNGLFEQGFQAVTIAKQLADTLRAELVATSSTLSAAVVLELLQQLIEVPVSHDPERYLEIILLQAATVPESAPARTLVKETATPGTDQIAATKPKTPVDSPVEAPPQTETVPVSPTKTKKSAGHAVLDQTLWPQILGILKQRYNTLYGIVRMAHPDFSQAGKLELAFAFAFHQKRISDAKNRKLLADTIEQLTDEQIEIVCVVDKEKASQRPLAAIPPAPAPDTDVSTISNIFGGGELLES